MRRRVLLHMGLGKTGSTALQVAFVRNRELLAARGIRYPAHESDRRAAAGRSMSGNGQALLPFLAPRPDHTPEQAEETLAALLDEVRDAAAPTVLYSSEFLYGFDADRLARLARALAEEDVDLVAFLYVRDIAGLVVSSYAQYVKRRRYRGSMSDYIRSHHLSLPPERSVAGRLRTLHEVLTPANVVVRHYDTDRAQLFDNVATHVLGLRDLEGLDRVDTPVNRSLTPLELEWTRYINSAVDDDDAPGLAVDRFTHREPLEPEPHAILRSDLALLRERFQADVDWVNAHCGMDATLDVAGATPVVDDHDAPTISDRERFLLDVIGDFTGPQAAQRRRRQRAPKADRKGTTAPAPTPSSGSPSAAPAAGRGVRARLRRLVDRVRDRRGSGG